MKCIGCGGSGDRFIMEKNGHKAIVRFDERQPYLNDGYIDAGETECPLCGGYGVRDDG